MTNKYEKMIQELAQSYNPAGAPIPVMNPQYPPYAISPVQFELPAIKPKNEPVKVVKEEYKIKARFIVKYDILFLLLGVFLGLGIFVILANVTEIPQRIINISLAVSMSSLISFFLFLSFHEPFKINLSNLSNLMMHLFISFMKNGFYLNSIINSY